MLRQGFGFGADHGNPQLLLRAMRQVKILRELLVAFTDVTTAACALDDVSASYQRHSAAARSLATNVFSTAKVLPAFLDAAM